MQRRRKALSIFLIFMMLFTLGLPQAFAQVGEEPGEVTEETDEDEVVIEETEKEPEIQPLMMVEPPPTIKVTFIASQHVGAESNNFQTSNDCGGLKDPVVWHFVLNQLDGNEGALTLIAEFENAGSLTATGNPVGNGKVQHFYVGTAGHDKLLTALVPGVEAKLVLSHVCLKNFKYQPLSPVLECVSDNGDGTYTAKWGYSNSNSFTVDALESKFTGTVLDSSTPMSTGFLPGRHYDVFTTLFDGNNLVWTLKGPDGKTKTSTANKNSKSCDKTTERISPVLECVEDLGDGRYRAWWGYNSLNTTTVDAKESKFTGGGTLGETTTPPITSFLPGRQVKVFSTTF